MSYIACENHSIGFGRVIFVCYDILKGGYRMVRIVKVECDRCGIGYFVTGKLNKIKKQMSDIKKNFVCENCGNTGRNVYIPSKRR